MLLQMERVIQSIYHIDKPNFDMEFVKLLEEIEKCIMQSGGQINIDDKLLNLQQAYITKNYLDIADILQYELKSELFYCSLY